MIDGATIQALGGEDVRARMTMKNNRHWVLTTAIVLASAVLPSVAAAQVTVIPTNPPAQPRGRRVANPPTAPAAPAPAAQPAVAPPTGAAAPTEGAPPATGSNVNPNDMQATERVQNGRRVYVASTVIDIRGEIQRPFAFSVSGRSSLGYTYFETPVHFVREILDAVRRAPFKQ